MNYLHSESNQTLIDLKQKFFHRLIKLHFLFVPMYCCKPAIPVTVHHMHGFKWIPTYFLMIIINMWLEKSRVLCCSGICSAAAHKGYGTLHGTVQLAHNVSRHILVWMSKITVLPPSPLLQIIFNKCNLPTGSPPRSTAMKIPSAAALRQLQSEGRRSALGKH